jgi:hypothetical protein
MDAIQSLDCGVVVEGFTNKCLFACLIEAQRQDPENIPRFFAKDVKALVRRLKHNRQYTYHTDFPKLCPILMKYDVSLRTWSLNKGEVESRIDLTDGTNVIDVVLKGNHYELITDVSELPDVPVIPASRIYEIDVETQCKVDKYMAKAVEARNKLESRDYILALALQEEETASEDTVSDDERVALELHKKFNSEDETIELDRLLALSLEDE